MYTINQKTTKKSSLRMGLLFVIKSAMLLGCGKAQHTLDMLNREGENVDATETSVVSSLTAPNEQFAHNEGEDRSVDNYISGLESKLERIKKDIASGRSDVAERLLKY